MSLRRWIFAAVLASMPVVAAAQVPPVESTADPGQLEDANIDRTILMPTAQTQPKGSVAFHDYELFLMAVSYGVTDNVQLTATTLVPLAEDFPFFGMATVKARLVNKGSFRLAAQGALIYSREDHGDYAESVSLLAASGIGSACLDAGCGSLATASVTVVKASEEDEELIIYGGSLLYKMTRRTKLMVEVASAALWDEGSADGANGGLLSYGVRFYSGEIAGDIAFVKPVGEDADDLDEFPMGFPFINFTYRAF